MGQILGKEHYHPMTKTFHDCSKKLPKTKNTIKFLQKHDIIDEVQESIKSLKNPSIYPTLNS